MLTCWNQVEEILWFTTSFDFKKGAESLEPSSERRSNIELYMFNFGTKTFIIRLVIDDVAVVKMWSYERFANSQKEVSWNGIRMFFMIQVLKFSLEIFAWM